MTGLKELEKLIKEKNSQLDALKRKARKNRELAELILRELDRLLYQYYKLFICNSSPRLQLCT